jgi:type II secretory pathway component PulF
MAHISTTQLARFCNRVGTSLRAGIDARTIFEREAQRGGPRQREAMDRIAQAIRAGESVTTAFTQQNGFFPPLVCEMVAVGETTGKVDEVFLQLGEQYQHLVQLRRTFLNAIIWPGIQLVAAIFVISLFILVMGMISPAGGQPAFDPLGVGVGFSGVINFLLIVGGLGGAIAFVVWGFVRGRFGSWPVVMLMRVPMIGTCIETMALARMAWSLAMANNAGMDPRRSIKLALRSSNNSYYKSFQQKIDGALAGGAEIHEALARTHAFPSEFVDVVANGELSGTLPESLLRLSQDYRSRAESSSGILTRLASGAVWAFVVLILAGLVIRLLYVVVLGPGSYYGTVNELLNEMPH